MNTYQFTIIVLLHATDDDEAKRSGVHILRALDVLDKHNRIRLDKLGMNMLGPDGNDIPLLPPQFPEGNTP